MRFPWRSKKGLRSRREYVEVRMEVQNLKGIKKVLQLHGEDHTPTTAPQSSSVRSNL